MTHTTKNMQKNESKGCSDVSLLVSCCQSSHSQLDMTKSLTS